MLLWLAAALASSTSTPMAVLPFDNHSGDESFDALGLGLADMLVTDLAAVESLDLVERSRLADVLAEITLGEKGYLDPDVAVKAGKGVGATWLLVGAITAVEPELRIDARVVDAATGRVLHTTKVSGDRAEFFLIEKDLALGVLEELEVAVSPREAARIGRVATESFDAFIAYSQGLDALDRGAVEEARRRFDTALKADSGFGAATDAVGELRTELTAATASHEAVVAQGVSAILDRIAARERGEIGDDAIVGIVTTLPSFLTNIPESDQVQIYERILALELPETVMTGWQPPRSVNEAAMGQIVLSAGRLHDRTRVLTWGQQFVERYPGGSFFESVRRTLDTHLTRIERVREAEASGEADAIYRKYYDNYLEDRCDDPVDVREKAKTCKAWLDWRQAQEWSEWSRHDYYVVVLEARAAGDVDLLERAATLWSKASDPEAEPEDAARYLEIVAKLRATQAEAPDILGRIAGTNRPEKYSAYAFKADVKALVEIGRFAEAEKGARALAAAFPDSNQRYETCRWVPERIGDAAGLQRCYDDAVAAGITKADPGRIRERLSDLEEDREDAALLEADLLEDLRNAYSGAQLYRRAAEAQQRIVDEFPGWRKREDMIATAAREWSRVYELDAQDRARALREQVIREFPDSKEARRAAEDLKRQPK